MAKNETKNAERFFAWNVRNILSAYDWQVENTPLTEINSKRNMFPKLK